MTRSERKAQLASQREYWMRRLQLMKPYARGRAFAEAEIQKATTELIKLENVPVVRVPAGRMQ